MVALKFTEADFETKVREAREAMAKIKVKANAAFEWFIQGSRDLLGDRPKIEQAVSHWGRATASVTAAERNLSEAWNMTGWYWTGDGATHYMTWLNNVRLQNIVPWKTTIGSNGGASGAIVTGLNKASEAVVTFLNGLYEALVTLITGLLDAASGLAGMIKQAFNPGAVVEAGVKALNAYINTCQKLFATAAEAVKTMTTAGNDIWVAGAALPEIVSPGDGLGDLGLTPTKSVMR